jgi:hypothetical protein
MLVYHKTKKVVRYLLAKNKFSWCSLDPSIFKNAQKCSKIFQSMGLVHRLKIFNIFEHFQHFLIFLNIFEQDALPTKTLRMNNRSFSATLTVVQTSPAHHKQLLCQQKTAIYLPTTSYDIFSSTN